MLPELNIQILDPDGNPYSGAEVCINYVFFRPEEWASASKPLGVYLSLHDGRVKAPRLSLGTYDVVATCSEWAIKGRRLHLTQENTKEQIILRFQREKQIGSNPEIK